RFATALKGTGASPGALALALGSGGSGRAPSSSLRATRIAEAADLILTIGCGFKQHATVARPSQRARHIQVDVDPAEINRDHLADVAILGDAKVVLAQLSEAPKIRLPPLRHAPHPRPLPHLRHLR